MNTFKQRLKQPAFTNSELKAMALNTLEDYRKRIVDLIEMLNYCEPYLQEEQLTHLKAMAMRNMPKAPQIEIQQ